jgi:hypothetical protein
MAKPDLGTKRICPETGRKFYDLNKDPIVSPYTGQSYPRSYFDNGAAAVVEDEEIEDKEVDTEEGGAELIDLDDDDVDLGDDEEDGTFLADDEEDEDDVVGIINVGDDDEEG